MSSLSIYRFHKFYSKKVDKLYHTEGGAHYVSDDASEYDGKGLLLYKK